MTALQAAQRYAKILTERYTAKGYEPDILVWDSAKVERQGFGEAAAQIVWEDGPYEWAIDESFHAIQTMGRLVEPYNGFILSFYTDC